VEGEEYDCLYWIGCAIAYDPELRGWAKSLLKVLKKAGLKVAILEGEVCCGEPARKVGDELMFVESARMVSELLSKYRFESIMTSCPHCYNALRNEYRGYGYGFEVESHVETLYRVVSEGLIKLRLEGLKATYHDPCYLSRWNGIVEEPRVILKAIEGLRLLEMPKRGARALCCGGGGGQAFYEVEEGERISGLRLREALETGAEALIVACPHCHSMFRGEELPESFRVYDIAELVAMSWVAAEPFYSSDR
jgi:Fe-S oxidoreductase